MSSRLLLLPGEILNHIFEYALSEEHGLEAIIDPNGIGWLCSYHNETTDTYVPECERDQGAIYAPPSNKVGMCKTDEGHIIANQLQYVCRQLRYQTKTLGIRYNTIIFRGKDPTAATTFLAGLSPRFQDSIRHLILRTNETDWKLGLSTGIFMFCVNHPKSSLSFHHPQLTSSRANGLLFTTFLIKHRSRGETTFVQKLSDNSNIQHQLLILLADKVKGCKVTDTPRNITFFPHDHHFDETAFRVSCGKNTIINNFLVPTLRNGIADLIAIAKDCYEKGI